MDLTNYRRNRNFVAQSYRIDRLPPGGVSKREFLETIYRAIESGSGRLPEGWDVTWKWRNKPGGIVRDDSLHGAVSKSRSSFLTVMKKRIERDFEKLFPGETISPFPVREATEREAEQTEEESEELQEARAGKEAGRKRTVRRREKRQRKIEFKRRSTAAIKGWITRRKHERDREQVRKRRKRGKR